MAKGSDIYAKIILSTDTKPVDAFAGQRVIESDTGDVYEWTGATWQQVSIGGAARIGASIDLAADLEVDILATPRGSIVTNDIILTNTTETTLLIAGAVGVFHDVTLLTLSNTSATKVRVDIRDATAGTIVLSLELAADGGGAVVPMATPMPQTTANNNWTAQLSGAVTDVRIKIIAIKNT